MSSTSGLEATLKNMSTKLEKVNKVDSIETNGYTGARAERNGVVNAISDGGH